MTTEREKQLQQEVQATLQRIQEIEDQLENAEDHETRANAQNAIQVVFGGFRDKLKPGEPIPHELRQLEKRHGYPVDASADVGGGKKTGD